MEEAALNKLEQYLVQKQYTFLALIDTQKKIRQWRDGKLWFDLETRRLVPADAALRNQSVRDRGFPVLLTFEDWNDLANSGIYDDDGGGEDQLGEKGLEAFVLNGLDKGDYSEFDRRYGPLPEPDDDEEDA
ncbi:hypothetical protein [Breznakiella homolactica]|uniref:Uncharacterized protein n=1 Tax=Breznakiella homolactica TaxID=2798577 RepID=A0A7T8B7K1_9SPIR|nr:hypothetical protein [Breznakiella homolactica]QQO07594.1 hypothetical protein JFL75_11620 [Breznakiella homolactica]